MQNLVSIYETHQTLIQKFILATLKQIDLNHGYDPKKLFDAFPSLELLYETNEALMQTSPNIYNTHEDEKAKNVNRSYLLAQPIEGHFFHEPYISTASGKLCITVVVKTATGYLFLDFRLRRLLERFELIVPQQGFVRFNRYAYIVMAGTLIILGLFISIYGFTSFIAYLLSSEPMHLEIFFKPVIALTLGMAVYDLGKTILEQEVIPKTQNTQERLKMKTLVNFLVSIIIALMIEALLMVFKISIQDYTQMHYAALLIVALALLLWVFSFMDKNAQKAA